MVLPMARPYPHPKTGVYWLRKAVPAPLRAAVGKREMVQSLGTKDAREARAKAPRARWCAGLPKVEPVKALTAALLLALQFTPAAAKEPYTIVCETAGTFGVATYKIHVEEPELLPNLMNSTITMEAPLRSGMTVLTYSDSRITAYLRGRLANFPDAYLAVSIDRETGAAEFLLTKKLGTGMGWFWSLVNDELAQVDKGSCEKLRPRF